MLPCSGRPPRLLATGHWQRQRDVEVTVPVNADSGIDWRVR